MTEKEKMIAGKIYDPTDETLLAERVHARYMQKLYNESMRDEPQKREEILDKLMPDHGEGCFIQGPVYFDYGYNTHVGKNFFANYNLTVLDVCPVSIGDNVFMGPNVSIMTPLHPLRYEERNPYQKADGSYTDKEYGKPITIGDNCWIGGNVTILPGAVIGSGCVIGAGSVVTGSIPDHYLAYGVPCKPIRPITEADSIENHPELF